MGEFLVLGVLHYADETGVLAGEGFQNLKALSEILIFKLLLKEFTPQALICLRLAGELLLKICSVFEHVVCIGKAWLLHCLLAVGIRALSLLAMIGIRYIVLFIHALLG